MKNELTRVTAREMTDETAGVPLIGRRQMLLMGATGLVTLIGLGGSGEIAFARSTVVSTPNLEEGPYWVDETGTTFHRTDVRSDLSGANVQAGLPLRFGLNISQVVNGVVTPLPNAFVYIWHCNALGIYSDESAENSASNTYLRGYQVTDAHGKVNFLTIYPGWYSGRTVHIHFRIRLYTNNDPTKAVLHDFETQVFFDDAITTHIIQTVAPYSQRPNRDTTNTTDHVYTGASLDADGVTKNAGALTTVKLANDTSHAVAQFAMILNLSLTETVGGGPGGGGPGGGGPGGP